YPSRADRIESPGSDRGRPGGLLFCQSLHASPHIGLSALMTRVRIVIIFSISQNIALMAFALYSVNFRANWNMSRDLLAAYASPTASNKPKKSRKLSINNVAKRYQ